jgi:hypothetical protein
MTLARRLAAAICAVLVLTAMGPAAHASAAAEDPIEELRQDAEHAASMLDQSPAGNPWASRIDDVATSGLSDEAREEGLARIRQEVDAVLNAIVAPEPFTFTMTGTSNTLRLPIRNTSNQPLRVDVRVRSPKLQPDEPLQEVVVPELESVEVEVPVTARSRGTFTIEVDVQAPDGHRLGAPVVLKGRVTHVTGLSQVVTGGAALVLGSWWYTHLRRRRAQRRVATAAQ